jgi:formylglycine-generating enzyme required for sulfatase activity
MTNESANRVFRGGGWNNGAALCRAAYRYRGDPDYRGNALGFRCVREGASSQKRAFRGGRWRISVAERPAVGCRYDDPDSIYYDIGLRCMRREL